MTPVRPEELQPLFRSVSTLSGIGPAASNSLERLNIHLVRDLLFHLPSSLVERQRVVSMSELEPPASVTVEVTVLEHRPGRHSGQPSRVVVEAADRRFDLVFFGRVGERLKRVLPDGEVRIVSGKLEVFNDGLQMTHPDYIVRAASADQIPELEPVYPLTDGISNKMMRKFIGSALGVLPDLAEWHDIRLCGERNWRSWQEALLTVHSCKACHSARDRALAIERLAFDEMAANQIALSAFRHQWRRSSRTGVSLNDQRMQQALDRCGFELTGSQKRVLDELLADLAMPERMLRLLQGDVGSGKTIIALLALVAACGQGRQGALMAPTEVLARQQFRALEGIAEGLGLSIGLVTGSDSLQSKRESLDALASGEVDIAVGTQSLIQQGVRIHDLRLAIVDEQHRFGVEQRRVLLTSNPSANLLMMTATPIPRSLALAKFGETDVSTLTEKPRGRPAITTAVIPASRTNEVLARLRLAVGRGQQAYWICPVVEQSGDTRYWTPEERAAELSSNLPGRVDFVHGRMPAERRASAMERFLEGDARILVATTVVEVGMDIPSATIMVIESAERFGLAQLHQLRGRVGRGTEESACVLIYNSPLTDMARSRLATIRQTNDGFEIAEADLGLRGNGDLLGVRQAGTDGYRYADPIGQSDLLEDARRFARGIMKDNPDFLSARKSAMHNLLFLFDLDHILIPPRSRPEQTAGHLQGS